MGYLFEKSDIHLKSRTFILEVQHSFEKFGPSFEKSDTHLKSQIKKFGHWDVKNSDIHFKKSDIHLKCWTFI